MKEEKSAIKKESESCQLGMLNISRYYSTQKPQQLLSMHTCETISIFRTLHCSSLEQSNLFSASPSLDWRLSRGDWWPTDGPRLTLISPRSLGCWASSGRPPPPTNMADGMTLLFQCHLLIPSSPLLIYGQNLVKKNMSLNQVFILYANVDRSVHWKTYSMWR